MIPSEQELKNADINAQDVVNAWGVNVLAGNDSGFTPEFKALFDKADRYRQARHHADFYRQCIPLSETDEGVATFAKERDVWQLFAEDFRVWRLSHKG